jgi:hypothetical protein
MIDIHWLPLIVHLVGAVAYGAGAIVEARGHMKAKDFNSTDLIAITLVGFMWEFAVVMAVWMGIVYIRTGKKIGFVLEEEVDKCQEGH